MPTVNMREPGTLEEQRGVREVVAPPTLLHGIGSVHDMATLCSYNRYCGCPKGEKECMRGEDRVRPVQSSSIPSTDYCIPTFPSPPWLQQPLTSSSKQS
jgi:hypothetical protein